MGEMAKVVGTLETTLKGCDTTAQLKLNKLNPPGSLNSGSEVGNLRNSLQAHQIEVDQDKCKTVAWKTAEANAHLLDGRMAVAETQVNQKSELDAARRAAAEEAAKHPSKK